MLNKLALPIAISYTIALAILSLLNLSGVPVEVKSNDKFLHVVAYFILGIIWLWVLPDPKTTIKVIVVVNGIIIYGIVLEVLQGRLKTHRMYDVLDIIANSIGVLLAMTLFLIRKRRLR